MQIQNPELLNKLATWRSKSVDGTITLEEMREAVKLLRENRMSTADAAAKSKTGGKKKATAAKAAPVNASDLLDQLNGL